MKKMLIAILLVVLVTIPTFVACGTETEYSSKAVSIVKQAIEITDAYLDGTATYDDVSTKFDELKESLAYADSLSIGDEYYEDKLIRVDLTILQGDIFSDSHNGSIEDYDNIVAKRNELAENAGLKKRK